MVLAGDIGATHSRVAITDLAGAVLAELTEDVPVAAGPEVVLSWLERSFDRLLEGSGRGRSALRGVGVGLPGPVEFATGRPVSPPIMPGWNLHPVGARLSERFGVPALVDNDVNIMALGEYWTHWRDEAFLIFMKIGTGIACGIVASGHVHRGADGAAGDIGHIHVPDHDDVICQCGNVGCLEAIAGGAAMAARLSRLGLATRTSRDVVDQVLAGQPDAVRSVRQSGHVIGGVLATCVNVLNPAVIIIGGDVASGRTAARRHPRGRLPAVTPAGDGSPADRPQPAGRRSRHHRCGDGPRDHPRPRRSRRRPGRTVSRAAADAGGRRGASGSHPERVPAS